MQIIKDQSLDAIDIGLLYSPQYLPDLDIEQVGEEKFVMVSTDTTRLNEVSKETYISTNYKSFFSQRHRKLLPEFTNVPITLSFEGLAFEFLRRVVGSTYIPMRVFGAYGLRRVEDAPVIQHPIFAAAHIRRRHYPDTVKALAVLRETLQASA